MTVTNDILDRVKAIAETIPSIASASKYWWDATVTSTAKPAIFMRLADRRSERVAPMEWEDTLIIAIRLVVGAAAAGQRTQFEQTLIDLYDPVLDRFRQVPKLNDPKNGANDLQYVTDSHITVTSGTSGFVYDTPTEFQIGTDFTLEVKIRQHKGRTT